MQNDANHHQPDSPIQAPSSLQARVFGRIQQAEQAAQGTIDFSTAFANSDWTLRLAALEQLAYMERERALPWLERALSDTHPSVRAWAVHVSGQHQAFALIQPALCDPDWQVREAALLALHTPETQISQELLIRAQSDPDAAVSQTAQELLHRQPLHPIHAGDTQQMTPINQRTQPRPLENADHELGTLQNIPQRPRRRRPRYFWPLIAASVALILVLGNLIALRLLGQAQPPAMGHQPAIGTTLWTHTFPQHPPDSQGHTSRDYIFLGTLAWSPNGQRLAIVSGSMGHGAVHIWDALTGTHEVMLTPPLSDTPARYPAVVASQVAWSPDGTLLASVIGDVQIWNPTTGTLITHYPPNKDAAINHIAWSPDGRYLAVGNVTFSPDTSGVAIWDIKTGMLVKTLSASILTMAWSPDGQYLATLGTRDYVDGFRVAIWNTSTWSRIQVPSIDAAELAWSPDSTRLAIGQLGGTINILEIATGKMVLTYHQQTFLHYIVSALAWSPDGKRIVSAGVPSMQIWNATSGQRLFTYSGQTANMRGNPFFGSLTWSPDGQYIASSTWFLAGGGGTVEVWRAV